MPPNESIDVRGPDGERYHEVLTPEALAFVATLQRTFGERRHELLNARRRRQERLSAGEDPTFLEETREVREGDWQVAPVPEDLQDRRVEITGPTDRKMMINALNSGAKVFMADLEDANSPTWDNMVTGQVNLMDAVRGTIEFTKDDGTHYALGDEPATLMVRPRGWHLEERHLLVDGAPCSASLFDFGLYFFHNAQERLDRGTAPYFYLPKLESHLEARLWNAVFVKAQDELGIPQGTIKATVLLETILAAFEMEEILYELREHSAGLNAGRWDYIFSAIKRFRDREDMVLPDRGQVTMAVPFMHAYTELLVHACHKRGAHAMGGMAAFIPSKDPEVNERAFRKVREDKEREAGAGFDGTWIAHPGLLEVAQGPFDKVLGDRANQVDNKREDVTVEPGQLIDVGIDGAAITEDGLRLNVNVALQYIDAWLRGWGAAAINNLMEDAATAEISRSQVWQWVHHNAELDDGRPVTRDLVRSIIKEELDHLRHELGDEAFEARRFEDARALFEAVALGQGFPEFLTLPAYEELR